MTVRPGRPPAPFVKRNPQKNFFKKYLTFCAARAIIITVIGGTKVNPKYRKEVNKNMEIFKNELELIKDEKLRAFTDFYLSNCVPNYFWEIGASASGKYHPPFSQGEGGLVRHTKAVVYFCDELMRMSQWAYMTDRRKDYAIMACILHDTVKYGFLDTVDKNEYRNHAKNAASNIEAVWEDYFNTPAPYELIQAVASHMGQWSTERDDRPFTPVDRLVHMADYIASRRMISNLEIFG